MPITWGVKCNLSGNGPCFSEDGKSNKVYSDNEEVF